MDEIEYSEIELANGFILKVSNVYIYGEFYCINYICPQGSEVIKEEHKESPDACIIQIELSESMKAAEPFALRIHETASEPDSTVKNSTIVSRFLRNGSLILDHQTTEVLIVKNKIPDKDNDWN